jgi:PAS domain-containing protein
MQTTRREWLAPAVPAGATAAAAPALAPGPVMETGTLSHCEWLEVNRAFCRLLGYDEEELLTLTLADLTVLGDATVKVDESEGTRSVTRYLRADGSPLSPSRSLRASAWSRSTRCGTRTRTSCWPRPTGRCIA